MMQNVKQETVDVEIVLKNCIEFFRRTYRLIILMGLISLIISIAYVMLAPQKFEAVWQMQMAQQVTSTGFTNAEEPTVLIERMKSSATYPAENLQKCGISNVQDSDEYLDNALKIKIAKGLSTDVEMRFRGGSIALARQCAEGLISMIIDRQRGLIEERLLGRQDQVLRYQQAANESLQQIERIKKSELADVGYLVQMDRLGWLRSRIDTLQEEKVVSQLHPAKLTSPIIVSNKPVAPNIKKILLLGLGLGLVFGTLFAFIRERKKMTV